MKRIIWVVIIALLVASCDYFPIIESGNFPYTIVNSTGRIFPCISIGDDIYVNIPIDGTIDGSIFDDVDTDIIISASIWEDDSGSLFMDNVAIMRLSFDYTCLITIGILIPSELVNAWRYTFSLTYIRMQ